MPILPPGTFFQVSPLVIATQGGSSPRGAGLWVAYPQGPPCLFFPPPRAPRVNQPSDWMVWGTVFGVPFLSELIMSPTRGAVGREGWCVHYSRADASGCPRPPWMLPSRGGRAGGHSAASDDETRNRSIS